MCGPLVVKLHFKMSLLCSAPVMAALCLDKLFKIQVDASQVGAGAVLLQETDGVDRPVCYFSKKFKSYQHNYSRIEMEALALIWALQNFEFYLGAGGGPSVVYTDHNPLTILGSLQCPNQRLMQWSLLLQSHSLDVRHIKGKDYGGCSVPCPCGLS